MTSEPAFRIDYSRPDWQGRDEEETARRVRCLLVLAAGATWALPIVDVAEVAPWREPARLPGASNGVGGRSGSYFHIYSLARLLGRQADVAAGGHIVRLRILGRSVALQVDRAIDVADVILAESGATESLGRLHPAASGLGEAAGYPALTIIDAERLFRPASRFSSEVE